MGLPIKEVREALLDAYPDQEDLEMMVDCELDESLNAIASGKTYRQIVYKLIKWAEAQDRLEELIEKASEDNPRNPKLKALKDKLNPSLFGGIETDSDEGKYLSQQWESLQNVLVEIDLDILEQMCKQVLHHSQMVEDINGTFPELINVKNLGVIKKILLIKCPKREDGMATVIEFVERLSKLEEIDKNNHRQLKEWLEIVVTKLNISLPTYPQKKLVGQNQAYLLITIEPKIQENIYLEAELVITNKNQSRENIVKPIELEAENTKVESSLEEISEKVHQFIVVAKEIIRKNYAIRELAIEIFAPLKYLEERFDLKTIPDGFGSHIPLGKAYRLVMRSVERLQSNGGEYHDKLSLRWEKLRDFLASKPKEEQYQTKYRQICESSNCDWDGLADELEIEEQFGLQLKCCLPETPEERRKVFISVIKGGVPICLWLRCSQLDVIQDGHKYEKVINQKTLKNGYELYTQVWQIRRNSHSKRKEAQQYLGYHLGLLYDCPQRVPFRLQEENQLLIPTGY